MTFDEIREFGSLVSAYRSEMPVEDFCTSLVKLYGSERRYLLKGVYMHGNDYLNRLQQNHTDQVSTVYRLLINHGPLIIYDRDVP